jgi:ferredoxin
MKAKVNQDCTGCGVCEHICADVFELDGDVAKVIVDVVPEDEEDNCRQSAEACPVDAIELEE